MHSILGGVWATMVTPYNDESMIDYSALKPLIEWYHMNGVAGLFAVCQSSEMFFLSRDERVLLARNSVKFAEGMPVVASGNTADRLDDQIEEIKAISDTGINAFVLIANKLAKQDEPDSVWRVSAERVLEELPGLDFGIYECPYPYKRLMSPELLRWCASTGRFLFLKDTSCDAGQIKAKLDAIKGTRMRLYNANTPTLLSSLRDGAAGYSGVMANFFPKLYALLCKEWTEYPELAERAQDLAGTAALLERQSYPINAKVFLASEEIPIKPFCRSRELSDFTSSCSLEIMQAKRTLSPLVDSLCKTMSSV
jgi:4-hydroxy-tetrahydrodipicolinate synthase